MLFACHTAYTVAAVSIQLLVLAISLYISIAHLAVPSIILIVAFLAIGSLI